MLTSSSELFSTHPVKCVQWLLDRGYYQSEIKCKVHVCLVFKHSTEHTVIEVYYLHNQITFLDISNYESEVSLSILLKTSNSKQEIRVLRTLIALCSPT